jgi:hypothetical protein
MEENKQKNKADVQLINKPINEYYSELSDDMNVTIFNLRDRSLSVSAIRAKWLMYFFKEKENMKRLTDAKSKAVGILLEKYNKDPSKRSIINKKLEDEINTENPQMVRLNQKIVDTKEVVQFLEFSINIMNDYGFTVKNAIDALKLEQA